MLKKLIQKLKSKKSAKLTEREIEEIYEQNDKKYNESFINSYEKFVEKRDAGISLEEMLNEPTEDPVSKTLRDGNLIWFESIYERTSNNTN